MRLIETVENFETKFFFEGGGRYFTSNWPYAQQYNRFYQKQTKTIVVQVDRWFRLMLLRHFDVRNALFRISSVKF